MVSDPLLVFLGIDDTEFMSSIDKIKAKVDEVVADWSAKRAVILAQINTISQGIGLAIRAVRMGIQAVGGTLDPMQNAILAMISSTTSIMIATASALAIGSLGLLTGVALALAAFAYGFSMAQQAKALADFLKVREEIMAAEGRLSALERFSGFRPSMTGGL